MFRRFRNLVRSRKPLIDNWSNRALEIACAAFAAAREEDARLRRRFPELSAAGTYEAAIELDQIRARLDSMVAEIAARQQDVEREAAVEAIVNQLLPTALTLRGVLDRAFEEFCSRADTPNDEAEWTPFAIKNKEFERLRLTIVQAVGPAEAERLDLDRAFNYVSAVEQHWADVARDRERLAVLHGPGNKIRFDRPAWFEQADRLARLRAGRTSTKEAVYAVR